MTSDNGCLSRLLTFILIIDGIVRGAGANMSLIAAVRKFVRTGNAFFILRALDIQHIFIKTFIYLAHDQISAFTGLEAGILMGTFSSRS
jgi:hypothetical protein